MKTIQVALNQIFKNMGLSEDLAILSPSQRPDLADYQVNGAMGAAKTLKKSPALIAQMVVEQIPEEIKSLASFSCVQGFINLKLTDKSLLSELSQNLSVPQKNKKVVIDFSGPNVAKAMHVGHVRSTLIGACLVNLYRYQGNKVTADNHLGDFGTPLGIVITQIQKNPTFQWTLSNIEKVYVEGSILYKNDLDFKEQVKENTYKLQTSNKEIKEVWQKVVDTTINSLKQDYAKLGIEFDSWLGESYFQDVIPGMIQDLKAKKLCQESSGAWVIDVGLENPLLLEKSGGGFLYQTTDLACVMERSKEFDSLLYVVDNRQKLHFEQLFEASKRTNLLKSGQHAEHVAFGTINGPDNRPYKTRDGGVLKLSELISEAIAKAEEKMSGVLEDSDVQENKEVIGIGALKFAELKHNRLSDYVFDLDKFMALEGFTGPYVMYACVRAKSLLEKNQMKSSLDKQLHSESERNLVLQLNQFSEAFEKSLKLNEPHHLCEYAFKLANSFNSFYHNHPLLKESDLQLKAHRLALVESVVKTLETTLGLLGIQIPKKM